VAFRGYAKEKGYTLNEHKMEPIREGVTAVPVMRSEADIFAFLGLKYVEPTKRRDGRDVEPL
jgi:DNA polymerase/3'-5' exonuclease PolX